MVHIFNEVEADEKIVQVKSGKVPLTGVKVYCHYGAAQSGWVQTTKDIKRWKATSGRYSLCCDLACPTKMLVSCNGER